MTAMVCSACGTAAYPSLVLNDKMVMAPSCPACGREHPELVGTTSVRPLTHSGVATPDWNGATKVARGSDWDGATPVTSTDVVSLIKKRIEHLDFELAKCAGYAAERKRLAKMLGRAEKTL